ncbi:MAG: hypothetical protein ABIU20_11460 [Blastocatellia bacterium]
MTKTAEVYTNDPQKEQFTLAMSMIVLSDMTPKGKIVGPFIVGPSNQWSARVPRGMSLNGLVAVTNNTEQSIKVTKMIPGGEAFKIEMQTLEEGKRYSLNFVSRPDLPLGSNKQFVKLLTDSKEMPELTVELEAIVYPAVSVTPTHMVFENVSVSDPDSDVTFLSKFLWVSLGRGDGLQVTSMTSDLPFVKIKVESNEPSGRSVILRVGFNAKPPVGTHTGKIKIETNNSDVKFFEIPITVTAK